jgi:polysaccharide export outer membrane protein
MKKLYIITFFAYLLIASSCGRMYKQNRMFETDVEYLNDSIQKILDDANKNYVLQPNDYISIALYSNQGERLVDPDFELSKNMVGVIMTTNKDQRYLVRGNGFVLLPMVGDINVQGLTLFQCDSTLSAAYSKYYVGAFVITKMLNKRFVILGPSGAKVIPLDNQNISLIEAIALYGGILNDGKAHNIRVIRGDLKNPHVQVVNLQTIDGMRAASLDVLPGDIIYIEPVRKIFTESLTDVYPLISALSSIITLSVLIVTLSRK